MHRTLVLAGDRIALAVMTEADQPFFQAWLQNPELRALIHDHRAPTIEDQLRWFARVQKPDRCFFSLVTVPEGRLIGNAGFVDIDPAKGEATLRITIGDPEAVGHGYGSEAVALLTQYAFGVAGWQRIFLKVLATNERAIHVYEKAGFRVCQEDVQDGTTIRTMLCSAP